MKEARRPKSSRANNCLSYVFYCSLVLAIVACAFPAQAGEISGRAYVRDGDTIVVAGRPVRLSGVDAPELSNRYGREASAYMKRLLTGREVTCDLNGEISYDRWIGVCYIESDEGRSDIGAVLIANGYALDCARYSGGRYRSLEPRSARSKLRQASYCN